MLRIDRVRDVVVHLLNATQNVKQRAQYMSDGNVSTRSSPPSPEYARRGESRRTDTSRGHDDVRQIAAGWYLRRALSRRPSSPYSPSAQIRDLSRQWELGGSVTSKISHAMGISIIQGGKSPRVRARHGHPVHIHTRTRRLNSPICARDTLSAAAAAMWKHIIEMPHVTDRSIVFPIQQTMTLSPRGWRLGVDLRCAGDRRQVASVSPVAELRRGRVRMAHINRYLAADTLPTSAAGRGWTSFGDVVARRVNFSAMPRSTRMCRPPRVFLYAALVVVAATMLTEPARAQRESDESITSVPRKSGESKSKLDQELCTLNFTPLSSFKIRPVA